MSLVHSNYAFLAVFGALVTYNWQLFFVKLAENRLSTVS